MSKVSGFVPLTLYSPERPETYGIVGRSGLQRVNCLIRMLWHGLAAKNPKKYEIWMLFFKTIDNVQMTW